MSKADIVVGFIFLLLFVSIPCAVLGPIIIGGQFYYVGFVLRFGGELGVGLAIIGLGIIEIHYPKQIAKQMLVGRDLTAIVRLGGVLTVFMELFVIYEAVKRLFF